MREASLQARNGDDPAFFKKGNMLGVTWHDTKKVSVLSTVHSSAAVDKEIRDRRSATGTRQVKKPKAFDGYNKSMGGVDRLDQRMAYYRYPHRHPTWYMLMYHFLMEVTLVNAFFAYCMRTGNAKANVYKFRLQVINGLLQNYANPNASGRPKVLRESSRDNRAEMRYTGQHFAGHNPTSKYYPECVVCSKRHGMRLNPERQSKDLKEAFNYCPSSGKQPFPDDEVPEFQPAIKALFNANIQFHNRVLEIMARGLKLEDPQYFVKRHQLQGTKGSSTTLRTLYYPPLATLEVKEDQVRCGEHSDYGGITLLYQDTQAGLEVRNVNNKWIAAPPIEGTVVVNIGDLMQRWTADKLIASKHRVMLPVDQIRKQQGRQSIAFFGQPDNEIIVECIDKSNKYPPIQSLEYLNMRFSLTF